jgi:hypothetical protein
MWKVARIFYGTSLRQDVPRETEQPARLEVVAHFFLGPTMKKITTKPRRKSKGKHHPAHAASFEHMAAQLNTWTSNFPVYKNDLINLFETEAKRLRSIVR